MHLYTQNGKTVAYRVMRRRNEFIEEQRYFYFREYGSASKAYKAARIFENNLNAKHGYSDYIKSLFNQNGTVKGLKLSRIMREKYTQEFRYLNLQVSKGKHTLRRSWSFNCNDWETAFEEAVKLIIDFRAIELDFEIADRFNDAKTLYDPTRRSNWGR